MPSLNILKEKDFARFPLKGFPHTYWDWTQYILRLVERLNDDEPVIIAGSSALAVLCEHIGMKPFFPVSDIDVFCLKDHDQFKRVAIDMVMHDMCTKLKAIRAHGCILSGKFDNTTTKIQFIGFEREHGGNWVSLLNHFDVRVCRVAIVKLDGEWTIVAAPGVLYDLHRKATEIVLPSPAKFKSFCLKYGDQADRIVALYERGEARRDRYIEKGFTVHYFDEGPVRGVNQTHPVEVWLAEVVFNRLFTVPHQYLLGGKPESKETADRILQKLIDLFGEELMDQDGSIKCCTEPVFDCEDEDDGVPLEICGENEESEEDCESEPILERKRLKKSSKKRSSYRVCDSGDDC